MRSRCVVGHGCIKAKEPFYPDVTQVVKEQ